MVDFGRLIRTAADHKTVCTATWAALLADGTRALITAGRWKEAERLTTTHRGIGSRLLDGRQVSIIARLKDGQPDHALQILDQSTPAEHWELAVSTVLRQICSAAIGTMPTQPQPDLKLVHELVANSSPPTRLFAARVGLTALSTMCGASSIEARALIHEILRSSAEDSYAAKDALAHPVARSGMAITTQDHLTRTVEASSLGGENLDVELMDSLHLAVAQAETRLRSLLGD
ncbi:hypothetical protein LO762_14585 [Actinocorallia sp. API 0066]|uniref:hypothetical protein n=1 Tax=Actinocorallia sp. API 0066 TaxID=2896846 RepID=UPI001E330D25|nr:hypothetical protein [Actinocorallia sp. API 0066]MCD0450409.1 hypothetical protein [Actinocorallia sp. API 0066]